MARKITLLLSSLVLVGTFQNCSGSKFDGADVPSDTSLASTLSANAFQPNVFSFVDQSGASLSTSVVSNSVQLAGSGSDAVPAICNGCTAQLNGSGAFLGNLSVHDGDTIQIRLTSSPQYQTATTASIAVGSITSKTWTVTTVAAPSQASSCVSSMGQSCVKGSLQNLPGCGGADSQCANFVGFYYGSQTCEAVGSYIEYSFDGTHELFSGPTRGTVVHNEVLGDFTSAYRCTYLGSSIDTSFHAVADGSCHAAVMAGSSTRLVPGTGCVHSEFVQTGTGLTQCDGSCL